MTKANTAANQKANRIANATLGNRTANQLAEASLMRPSKRATKVAATPVPPTTELPSPVSGQADPFVSFLSTLTPEQKAQAAQFFGGGIPAPAAPEKIYPLVKHGQAVVERYRNKDGKLTNMVLVSHKGRKSWLTREQFDAVKANIDAIEALFD